MVRRAQRRRLSPEADARERLSARIAELEQRLKLLEARVRVAGTPRGSPAERAATAHRPRPRCPGCLLELPQGRRGECCVWCGFVFDATAESRRLP